MLERAGVQLFGFLLRSTAIIVAALFIGVWRWAPSRIAIKVIVLGPFYLTWWSIYYPCIWPFVALRRRSVARRQGEIEPVHS